MITNQDGRLTFYVSDVISLLRLHADDVARVEQAAREGKLVGLFDTVLFALEELEDCERNLAAASGRDLDHHTTFPEGTRASLLEAALVFLARYQLADVGRGGQVPEGSSSADPEVKTQSFSTSNEGESATAKAVARLGSMQHTHCALLRPVLDSGAVPVKDPAK